MERYALGWSPSPSSLDLIANQQVLASIAGAPQAAILPVGATVPDIAPGMATAQFDFPTDAQVIFVVATFGKDGSSVLSDPFTFVAADHEAVAPATGLSATWVSHSA